jgi:hypothetical protein
MQGIVCATLATAISGVTSRTGHSRRTKDCCRGGGEKDRERCLIPARKYTATLAAHLLVRAVEAADADVHDARLCGGTVKHGRIPERHLRPLPAIAVAPVGRSNLFYLRSDAPLLSRSRLSRRDWTGHRRAEPSDR